MLYEVITAEFFLQDRRDGFPGVDDLHAVEPEGQAGGCVPGERIPDAGPPAGGLYLEIGVFRPRVVGVQQQAEIGIEKVGIPEVQAEHCPPGPELGIKGGFPAFSEEVVLGHLDHAEDLVHGTESHSARNNFV